MFIRTRSTPKVLSDAARARAQERDNFWLMCVNKVSLCNDPPVSVRPSVRPTLRPFVRPAVTNLNMGNISDTTDSRVMKPGPVVLCDKNLKWWKGNWPRLGQGHRVTRVTLKYWKIELLRISYTFKSRDMKLVPMVLWDKPFKSVRMKMTLTQCQGHRVILKCWKIELFPDNSDTINPIRTK